MTSALYIRTVRFTRPAKQLSEGAIGYGGATLSAETPVTGAQNLPASIQLVREGRQNEVKLPDDATLPFWDIFCPKNALAAGVVHSGDLAYDDLGNRFQVVGPYVNRLGARIRVQSTGA